MAYVPAYTVTPALVGQIERIAALRERIQNAAVSLAWIPALQKDTRSRNVHASTAIEGNPLTLEEVRALEEGRELAGSAERPKREVLNYFAGLRHVEKRVARKSGSAIRHEDVFELHRILAGGVMDQGRAGRYRDIAVRVGSYVPPRPPVPTIATCVGSPRARRMRDPL
jgi:Fic family protein